MSPSWYGPVTPAAPAVASLTSAHLPPAAARAEGPHRVEQVRHGRHAEIEGCVRLSGGRVRVPCGDDDLALEEVLDQRARAVELGRERELRNAARVEQPLEQREIRIAPVLERMRAEPLR